MEAVGREVIFSKLPDRLPEFSSQQSLRVVVAVSHRPSFACLRLRRNISDMGIHSNIMIMINKTV